MTITARNIVPDTSTAINITPSRVKAKQPLSERACQYHTLGFNVIALHGKKPLAAWKSDPDWTMSRQELTDVERLNWRKANQIAAVCGPMSGDLVCVDFDKQPDRVAVDQFLAAPGLPVDYSWCEQTPSGGYHVWLICHDLRAPDDHQGGKVDRAGRLAGHIELRFAGLLANLYFDKLPSTPPAAISGDQLVTAYDAITRKPEDRPVAETPRRSDRRASHAGSFDQYLRDDFEPRIPSAWLKGARNSKGFHKNVPCPNPHHEDRNPSFGYNPESHTGFCFVCGAVSTDEIADLIGAPRYQGRPAAFQKRDSHKQQSAADAIHYAHGFPWTLLRFLLTVKLKTVARLDLAPLAVVEFLHTVCNMPEEITITQFVQLAAVQGWTVDQRLVSAGMKQGAEMTIYNFAPIGSNQERAIGAKLHFAVCRFKTVDQRLRGIGEYLAPLMLAPRRAPATVSEIAAIVGDSGEGLDEIDAGRAETVAAIDQALPEEQRRAAHDRRAARWLAVWEGMVRRILDGSYQPISLEPQAISAPKLRAAIARQLLGEGIEVRRLVAVTGLSKHTVLKLARENDLVSVPQTATILADQVSESVRQRGLVIDESDGMATIHTPNVFKKIDHLTAEEQRAVSHQEALQRGRAYGRLSRPDNAQEAAQRRRDKHNQKADENAARVLVGMLGHDVPKKARRDPLEKWLDYQWEIAPPLSPPPIDLETGEVLKGRARWLAAFEVIRGETMPFSHYSEPEEPPVVEADQPEVEREAEDRQPSEPPQPSDLPAGQTVRIDLREFSKRWELTLNCYAEAAR
jgi:hypothetical protein